MKLQELYDMRDQMHVKIDSAFEQLEKEFPKEKGVDVDIDGTDIANDAWGLFKEGVGEIASIAGDFYGTYID